MYFIIMGPICIGFIPFFVDCLLFFFFWIVSTCALICMVRLMDGSSSSFSYENICSF